MTGELKGIHGFLTVQRVNTLRPHFFQRSTIAICFYSTYYVPGTLDMFTHLILARTLGVKNWWVWDLKHTSRVACPRSHSTHSQWQSQLDSRPLSSRVYT